MKSICKFFVFHFLICSSLFGQSKIGFNDLFLDSIVDSRFSNKKLKSIKEVSESLKIDTKDQFLQYHVLAKWMVKNLNYNEESKNDKSLIKALKNSEGVCYHYSIIFDSLCKYLNFNSFYITGLVKEFAENGDLKMITHAWNAVIINDVVYMSDLTWSDGNNQKKSKEAKLLRDYFLVPPEKFILSHFPDEKKYRFTQYSFRKFKKSSIIENGYLFIDSFFNHNIDLFDTFLGDYFSIKLSKKTNSLDTIEIIGFEILPCANCNEFVEVIKFEKNDELDFSIQKSKLSNTVKNTSVILLVIYRKKNELIDLVKPVIQFKW